MTPEQIIADLKSRGEKNIRFMENGIISSQHGMHTHNTWVVQGGELACIDCKTIY